MCYLPPLSTTHTFPRIPHLVSQPSTYLRIGGDQSLFYQQPPSPLKEILLIQLSDDQTLKRTDKLIRSSIILSYEINHLEKHIIHLLIATERGFISLNSIRDHWMLGFYSIFLK